MKNTAQAKLMADLLALWERREADYPAGVIPVRDRLLFVFPMRDSDRSITARDPDKSVTFVARYGGDGKLLPKGITVIRKDDPQ